jgi:hypothetical protein
MCRAAATTLWNVSNEAHYLAARLDGTTTFSQVYQEQNKRSFYPMEIISWLVDSAPRYCHVFFILRCLLASTLR